MAKLTPEQKAKIDEIQADLEEQVADLQALEDAEDPEPRPAPGTHNPADYVGQYWLQNVHITGYGLAAIGSQATLAQLTIFFAILNPSSPVEQWLGPL